MHARGMRGKTLGKFSSLKPNPIDKYEWKKLEVERQLNSVTFLGSTTEFNSIRQYSKFYEYLHYYD